MAEDKITKIELSDGSIYLFFDKGAIHYDKVEHKILVGDTLIDNVLIQNNLFILKIDDMDIEDISHYVVQNELTEEIGRIDKNKVLENIGGCSYSMDENNGILSLKIGKQNS